MGEVTHYLLQNHLQLSTWPQATKKYEAMSLGVMVCRPEVIASRSALAPRSLPKYHVTPTRYAPLLHGTIRLCAPSLTSQGPSFADFTPPGACYDIPHPNIYSLFPNLLVLAMKHELFGSRIYHSHDHRVLTNHTYP